MNMKMKNSEIADTNMAFVDIMSRKEKYPVKFAFAMSKNAKAVEKANKDFEEARFKLLDEYNVKDKAGEPTYKATGQMDIALEHRAAWEKEIRELLDIEVEFNVHMASMSVLEGVQIGADVLYACDFMLEE